MYIEPSREQLAELAASPESGPVVMINLLRFRPDGGAAAYAHYGEGVLPCLARVGGRILWQGRPDSVVIGDEADRWDAVVLVQYPSRQAFLAMIGATEYQAIAGLRTEALADSRLIATTALPAPELLGGASRSVGVHHSELTDPQLARLAAVLAQLGADRMFSATEALTAALGAGIANPLADIDSALSDLEDAGAIRLAQRNPPRWQIVT
jgi:uncharacterized protein (DUF1330 family)